MSKKKDEPFQIGDRVSWIISRRGLGPTDYKRKEYGVIVELLPEHAKVHMEIGGRLLDYLNVHKTRLRKA